MTAGSPVLRSALRDAVIATHNLNHWGTYRTEGGASWVDRATVADAIADRLAADPAVVEAFATALRQAAETRPPGAFPHLGRSHDIDRLAAALVAALLGTGS